MLRGKPKSDKTKGNARGGPENQKRDIDRAARKSATSEKSGRKSNLLRIILEDPRLSAKDKRVLRQAAKQPPNAQDMAAFVAYQIIAAQRAYDDNDLTAKDYIVALNKASSQLGAAVQLAGPGSGPSAVTVTFSLANLPSADHGRDRPPPGDTGDEIDVEG